MRHFKIASSLVTFFVFVTFFQNCSRIDFGSQTPNATEKSGSQSNGDGYTGLQVTYPKDVAANQKADIFVNSGEGPFIFRLTDGGRGTFVEIENRIDGAHVRYRAPRMVSPPYYATLEITDARGVSETIALAVGYDGFNVVIPSKIVMGSDVRVVVEGLHGQFNVSYADGGRGTLTLVSSTSVRAEYRYVASTPLAPSYSVDFKVIDQQGYEKIISRAVSP